MAARYLDVTLAWGSAGLDRTRNGAKHPTAEQGDLV